MCASARFESIADLGRTAPASTEVGADEPWLVGAEESGPACSIAPAVLGASGADNGAVSAQAERATPARRHGDDAPPSADVTLPVGIPARGQDGAVRAKTDGVRLSGVPCRVNISRCHRHNARPIADLAFTSLVAADRYHGAVIAHADRVASSCRQHRFTSHVHWLASACVRVLLCRLPMRSCLRH